MRNNTLSRITVLLLFVLFLSPAWAERPRADLSRLLVVGDSLSAGFQNGSLLETQQPHGYASLVAQQAGVPLALPLIAAPGIPKVLHIESLDPLVIAPVEAPDSPGRTNPAAQPMNLAVPGHKVHDALATRPNLPIDSITDLVLGLPGLLGGVSKSQVEWAEALHPTTVLLWIGNNDALGAAVAADSRLVTDVTAFEADFAQVIDRLANTGASLVVANIPDVTAVPFLTPAETVAARTGLPLEVIGPILGIAAGDFVTPDALPLIKAILSRTLAGPLPDSVVLDTREVADIRAAVAAYNAFIAAKAKEHGAALVDIHALFERIAARGIVVGGQRLTTAFLGGLFSLDGIHPTNTGYAVIANRFIRALNRSFDTDVQRVSLVKIKKDDPLVFPTTGRPPRSGHEHIGAENARSMRELLGR